MKSDAIPLLCIFPPISLILQNFLTSNLIESIQCNAIRFDPPEATVPYLSPLKPPFVISNVSSFIPSFYLCLYILNMSWKYIIIVINTAYGIQRTTYEGIDKKKPANTLIDQYIKGSDVDVNIRTSMLMLKLTSLLRDGRFGPSLSLLLVLHVTK